MGNAFNTALILAWAALIGFAMITFAAQVLDRVGIIDLRLSYWKRIARYLGLTLTAVTRSDVILEGEYRGRVIYIAMYMESRGMGGRMQRWHTSQRISVATHHPVSEFDHHLQDLSTGYPLSIYDFTEAVKQQSYALYRLAMRNDLLFDHLLELRGYRQLSAQDSSIIYDAAQIERHRPAGRELRKLIDQVIDFAETIEATTRSTQ